MRKLFNRIKHLYKKFPSLTRTILVNLYYLPLKDAIKFPIFVGRGVSINCLGNRNSVIVRKISRGSVCLGIGNGSYNLGKKQKSFFEIDGNGQIVFEGSCTISKGFKIHVRHDSQLSIGNGFSANANCMVCCDEKITIGNDVMLGWNVSIMDTDLHRLYDEDDNYYNKPSAVNIGHHVWVASGATVLKGCKVPDGVVIARNSVVTKSVQKTNCVVAGNPSQIVKSCITWSRDLCKE